LTGHWGKVGLSINAVMTMLPNFAIFILSDTVVMLLHGFMICIWTYRRTIAMNIENDFNNLFKNDKRIGNSMFTRTGILQTAISNFKLITGMMK
jgi:hypothetical protein